MSVRVAAAALAAAIGAASRAQQTDWQQCAFVRTEVARRDVVVGEVVRVRIVVGVEQQALQQHAVQLFRQELGLPAQVVAPWLDGGDGLARAAVATAATDAAADAVTIAVNDAVVPAVRLPDEVRGGRPFAVVALERRLRATATGPLQLAAPTLRLAFASAFRDDFVNGRVPVDRTDVAIPGAAAALTVRALPDDGRPAAFTGAVGEFTVTAAATPLDLAVGDRLELLLVVRGDGDLRSWPPPPLDVAGFHALGVLDRGGERERTLVYDLVPLDASVQQLPAIAFPFFAPGDGGGYRLARTAAIALHVRAAPAGTHDGARAGPATTQATGDDLADIATGELPRDRPPRLPDAIVLTALLLPWLLALLWHGARGRGPAASRATPQELAAAFAAAAERREVDLVAAFDAYLAVRLGAAARGARDAALVEQLVRAGVVGDLAGRAARLRHSLVAARYAGISHGAAVAAQQLVRELERAFADAEAGA